MPISRSRINEDLLQGASEGFHVAFSASIGLIPWAIAVGVAMVSVGFTTLQTVGMSVLVYAGVAQLGTIPLIIAGAPLWLIVLTALVLNLRFIIFSAAISPGFRDMNPWIKWLSSYLLIDGVFAFCLNKMLREDKSMEWRLGYYLAPALWGWLLWQGFTLVGAIAAKSIPKDLSLEFLATIALLTILLQVARARSMAVAAATAGSLAILLNKLPLRLGTILAIMAGIAAGYGMERLQKRKGR